MSSSTLLQCAFEGATGIRLVPISWVKTTNAICKAGDLTWDICMIPSKVQKDLLLSISFSELHKCPLWRMKIEVNVTFFVGNSARKLETKAFELSSKQRSGQFHFSESFFKGDCGFEFNGNQREEIMVKIHVVNSFGLRRRMTFVHNFLTPCDLWNLMLIVEDKKVFVDVNFLATYSNFFFHMKAEIAENMLKTDPESGLPFETLHDVDHTSFLTVLRILYPESHKITVENVEGVLKVADYMMFETILIKCENFLLSSKASCFSNCKKLELSLAYQMFDLQDQCLSQICSIRQIKEDPFFEDMIHHAKALLFDQIVSDLRI